MAWAVCSRMQDAWRAAKEQPANHQPDESTAIDRRFCEAYSKASLREFPYQDVEDMHDAFAHLLRLYRSTTKREVSSDWEKIRGIHMSEVKVGMKLACTTSGREVTVTEITDKGFKYSCEPYYMRGPTFSGMCESGECYGAQGYAY